MLPPETVLTKWLVTSKQCQVSPCTGPLNAHLLASPLLCKKEKPAVIFCLCNRTGLRVNAEIEANDKRADVCM